MPTVAVNPKNWISNMCAQAKADSVLQERPYSLPSVTVLKNVKTKEIAGNDKVRLAAAAGSGRKGKDSGAGWFW